MDGRREDDSGGEGADSRADLHDAERRHREERAIRIGRLKRWWRPLPRRANISRYPVLRHFAEAARRRPDLWSFERTSVRRAIWAGSLIAFQPVYGLQLFLALAVAIVFRANLAVTCAFQLITNPLTAGPLYWTAYRIGHWIIETLEVGTGIGAAGTRFNALVLGGLVLGLVSALVADSLHRFAVWEAARLRERHAAARRAASDAGPGRSSAAGRAVSNEGEPVE